MLLDGGVRVRKAPLDRLSEVVANPLELGERALEVLTLPSELCQALGLLGVLLGRERVDLPESLPTALQALDGLQQFLPLGFGELLRLRLLLEPAPELRDLRLEAGTFDRDRCEALARLSRRAPELGFAPAEAPKLFAELSRAGAARIDLRSERGLEPAGDVTSGAKLVGEALLHDGQRLQVLSLPRVDARGHPLDRPAGTVPTLPRRALLLGRRGCAAGGVDRRPL